MFPYNSFFLFLWGWVVARMRRGLFHNTRGGQLRSNCCQHLPGGQLHGNRPLSPSQWGMEPLVFCERWLVFLSLLLSFLRHHFVIRGDLIQEVCKKKYQISLNKGLLWLIIRARVIELETAQGSLCVIVQESPMAGLSDPNQHQGYIISQKLFGLLPSANAIWERLVGR